VFLEYRYHVILNFNWLLSEQKSENYMNFHCNGYGLYRYRACSHVLYTAQDFRCKI